VNDSTSSAKAALTKDMVPTWKQYLDKVRASLYSLLEVLVSLMVEEREELPNDEIWWDKDNSAVTSILHECSKRKKDSHSTEPDFTPDSSIGQTIGPILEGIPESGSDSDRISDQVGPSANAPAEPDLFGGGPVPSSAEKAGDRHAEVGMTCQSDEDTEETPTSVEMEFDVTVPKRIVPFTFDIDSIGHHGSGNYTLPPADTVWYEQRFDPKMSEFTEHGTHDGGGPNTWPSLFFQNSPPSSPPSLISDLGSSGSFERESQGSVVNIVVSQYIASGRCYDVYRGVAELQYEGYLDTVKVPIVAKYLDGEAEMPKAPGYDLYDDDERVVHVSSRSTRRTSNEFTDRASRLRTSLYSTSGNVMCFKF
jgi:hypothetical protein